MDLEEAKYGKAKNTKELESEDELKKEYVMNSLSTTSLTEYTTSLPYKI